MERELTNIFQRRHTDYQKAGEKMLNVISYQGNANQNHNELLPHTWQMAIIRKDNK